MIQNYNKIGLCSVVVITPDFDPENLCRGMNIDFRQPQFESGHDLLTVA